MIKTEIKNNRIPPKPAGWGPFGVLLRMQKDPLALLKEASALDDDLTLLNFGIVKGYLVNNPDLIKRVLQDNRENYPLGSAYEVLRPVFGNSISMSDGADWARQKKSLQPSFNHSNISQFETIMKSQIGRLCEAWMDLEPTKPQFDITQEMMRLSLSVVAKTFFNLDMDKALLDEIGRAYSVANQEVIRRSYRPINLPLFFPSPANRRFLSAIKSIEKVVDALIQGEGRKGQSHRNLLNTLFKMNEGSRRVNKKEIRDHIITILGAGHESTAVTLSWTWYLLDKNPEVETKLHQELAYVLQGRDPGLDDIRKLEYVRMIVEETMRLYPPGWYFLRTAMGNDTLGPYSIRAGSLIFLCAYTMHRDPKYWENPAVFDPNRFAKDRQQMVPRFAYFPFGGGPRNCIGQHFAMMEMILAISTIAQKFRLRRVRNHEVELEGLMTLKAKNGILMSLERR